MPTDVPESLRDGASRFLRGPINDTGRQSGNPRYDTMTLYTPPHYEERSIDVMHRLISAQPLATLVVPAGTRILATHVPMLVRPTSSAAGMLVGHVARANPDV